MIENAAYIRDSIPPPSLLKLLFNSPLFAHFTHGIRDTPKWKFILDDLNGQLDALERRDQKLPADVRNNQLRAYIESPESG